MNAAWLGVPAAARHVGYDGVDSADPRVRERAIRAFKGWAKSVGVPCGHRGDRPVYLPKDLDQALTGGPRAMRRAS